MLRTALFLAGAALLVGCSTPPKPTPLPTTGPSFQLAPKLSPPAYDPAVDAVVRPPEGWAVKQMDKASDHDHEVWLSPTGRTAYGIIRFDLPLPVGPQFVLGAYLSEMKKREGRADLISKTYDEQIKGLRFEAVGGRYHTYTNLMTRGWHGWFVYAGTGTDRPADPAELALAVAARENTGLGKPEEKSEILNPKSETNSKSE